MSTASPRLWVRENFARLLARLPLPWILLMGTPCPAQSQPKMTPVSLVASMELHHMMRDMMTVQISDYQVVVNLRVSGEGRAELQLQGTLDSHTGELSMDVRATKPSPRPRAIALDERWSGQARRDKDRLIVTFEKTSAFRPELAVDVEWECTPQTVQVGSATVAAWRCATAQSKTQRTGASHGLVPYMQVPLTLAAPSEKLRITALARGGANHRSTISSISYSRQP